MNQEIIPIFFSVDEKYVPYVSVAIKSLVENASHNRQYRVYILHAGLDAETLLKIEALSRKNVQIKAVEINRKTQETVSGAWKEDWATYFAPAAYFRLFLTDIFPEYDKGIYLDSDVVVLDDIAKLYDIELGDNLIGGCVQPINIAPASPAFVPGDENLWSQTKDVFRDYFDLAVGVPHEIYVNSGVLLMNLKALREEQFSNRFLELFSKYNFVSAAPDQDYFNTICYGRVKILDRAWNTMPVRGGGLYYKEPKIIHYNLFSKPWHYDAVPYGEIFWDYMAASPFEQKILLEKATFTPERQQKDLKRFSVMVRRGAEMVKADGTFGKILGVRKLEHPGVPALLGSIGVSSAEPEMVKVRLGKSSAEPETAEIEVNGVKPEVAEMEADENGGNCKENHDERNDEWEK